MSRNTKLHVQKVTKRENIEYPPGDGQTVSPRPITRTQHQSAWPWHTSLCTNSFCNPNVELRLKRGDHIVCPFLSRWTPCMVIRNVFWEFGWMLVGVIPNGGGDLLIGVKLRIIFLHRWISLFDNWNNRLLYWVWKWLCDIEMICVLYDRRRRKDVTTSSASRHRQGSWRWTIHLWPPPSTPTFITSHHRWWKYATDI
jgi:hypothetical protein